MSERADRDLVELARRGDAAAIGELFSRYWRAARAAAFGVTGEFASAEDAASEAFRQALAGLDSLRDPNQFGPWLRTIVVRKARLERESRRPVAGALDRSQAVRNEPPGESLERLELEAVIRHAVRELPAPLREAMALFYFEGYDSAAAARFLDIPSSTLRRRLHSGRKRLHGAVEQILKGTKRRNEEREQRIQSVKRLIDKGEVYRGLREALALRPPPHELTSLLMRSQTLRENRSQQVSSGAESEQVLRDTAQRFLRPSDRALDPKHPVGGIAAAIRKALPDFQEWPLAAGESAVRFLTFSGAHRDRIRALLPPGFAEGRPGAFLRASRALLRLGENGTQSIYDLLQNSPDDHAFRAASSEMRMSDVIDLTWMTAGRLELRSVQAMLERLTSAILPEAEVRFSAYDEPRYRSALQLQIAGVSARFAQGGVLSEWPGHPQGAGAAHVRIFLEPWAGVHSGRVVEFEPLPRTPGI
jgi:RNA polymerase sigma-70 factor (ECF subfamily)